MNCVDCGDPAADGHRCADCLEEVRETPNWRPMPRVSRPAARTRTAKCGHEIPSHRGLPRNFCDACKPAPKSRPARPARLCTHCNSPLTSRRRETRFCSLRCSALSQVRSPHPSCAEPDCEKPSRRHGFCKNHARLRVPSRSDLAHARKRNQMKNHARRGRARQSNSEMIDRDVVGDRDGWKCGICRRKVDRAKTYPHPRSPSLDHVIPQSEGGPHTYANVRISHLACNVARSDRGGGEQLALIG